MTIEQKLWKAANKLRNDMDVAEFRLIILGLIFLKYISEPERGLGEEKKRDDRDMPQSNLQIYRW